MRARLVSSLVEATAPSFPPAAAVSTSTPRQRNHRPSRPSAGSTTNVGVGRCRSPAAAAVEGGWAQQRNEKKNFLDRQLVRCPVVTPLSSLGGVHPHSTTTPRGGGGCVLAFPLYHPARWGCGVREAYVPAASASSSSFTAHASDGPSRRAIGTTSGRGMD
jgi:hypothetical protein